MATFRFNAVHMY